MLRCRSSSTARARASDAASSTHCAAWSRPPPASASSGEATGARWGTRRGWSATAVSGIALDRNVRLEQAFGFSPADVCATTRRAYLGTELYASDEGHGVPYFAANGKDESIASVLLVFLHEGGVLFGVCGLERTRGRRPVQAGGRRSARRPRVVRHGRRAGPARVRRARARGVVPARARRHARAPSTSSIATRSRSSGPPTASAASTGSRTSSPIEDALVNAAERLARLARAGGGPADAAAPAQRLGDRRREDRRRPGLRAGARLRRAHRAARRAEHRHGHALAARARDRPAPRRGLQWRQRRSDRGAQREHRPHLRPAPLPEARGLEPRGPREKAHGPRAEARHGPASQLAPPDSSLATGDDTLD